MYQHTTLIQNLNDSNLAELRRAARSHRRSEMRRDMRLRLTRPLARIKSH